jgi:hypothetical protein
VGELQRRNDAGDADRKAACHGGVAWERISLFVEKELRCGGGWRRLAAVDTGELFGGRVPVEDEGAPADA